MPFAVEPDWNPWQGGSAAGAVVGWLSVHAGLPFLAVSAGAPLIQRWASQRMAERETYSLYAASNAGSLFALLAYPALIEPWLGIREQALAWAGLYGVLLLLLIGCTAKAGLWTPCQKMTAVSETNSAVGEPSAKDRFRWIGLTFVPSSLMLSATTFVTTDLAPIPLLWVLPLALYLLTFIAAFARKPWISSATASRLLPFFVILAAIVLLTRSSDPLGVVLVVHLAALTFVGLTCHTRLAESRPPAEKLTDFYLWIAVGGLLGGCFNVLAAPLVFDEVVEYPLVLILACLLRRPSSPESGRSLVKLILQAAAPSAIAIILLAYVSSLGSAGVETRLLSAAAFGAAAFAAYLCLHHRLRFALALGGLFIVGAFYQGNRGVPERQDRTFFGLHRVSVDPEGPFRMLFHGNTVHGIQSLEPERAGEPLSYYSRTGPAGDLFSLVQNRDAKRIGVVGLGAGSLAAYGRPEETWTFYELDPTVIEIARDSGFFTYWRDSRAHLEAKVGDARLQLGEESGPLVDLLVLDAFSSDAIPLHLLTREALQIYLSRVGSRGLIAFHISNRIADLRPVLAALARDAGLQLLSRADLAIPSAALRAGKFPSVWAVVGAAESPIRELARSGEWFPVAASDSAVWTDDFSNVLGALRWADVWSATAGM